MMAMNPAQKRAFSTPVAKAPSVVTSPRQKRRMQLQAALRAKQRNTVRRGGTPPSNPIYS